MIRRIAGTLRRPRATFAGLVEQPAWAATWAVLLIVFAALGGWFLSTDVGQQALVDERVRVIESFGGAVSDAEYAALLANPPQWVYLTSGGRLLLLPPITVLMAGLLWSVARVDGAAVRFSQTLAIAVHASVVLLIGQLVATPLHYVRESLTSPLNLAAVLPLLEEGSVPARFFGTLDLFALWWLGLLGLGLSVLTRRPTSRYALPFAAAYAGFAVVVALTIAALGGV